jgi:hypothetical protein
MCSGGFVDHAGCGQSGSIPIEVRCAANSG